MRYRTRRGLWGICSAVLLIGFFAGVVCAQEARDPARTGAAAGYPVEGEVVGDAVAIRSHASTTSTRLALAYKGDRLRVLGETDEWYQVYLPHDYTMWVTKDLVVVGANNEGVINGDNVRARAGAGLQYQALGHLDRGRRIEVVDEKDGWLKFRFAADDRGYISMRYVTLAGETSPRGVEPGPHALTPQPTPAQPQPDEDADQKVMEDFNRAEEIYSQEVRKENIVDWKLDEAHTLYVGVLERTRNKNLLQKCRSRCAVITLALRYQQATATTVDPRKQLEQREKEIEEEFERKRKLLEVEIRSLFPTATAVGRIRKLASPWLRPATHKLVQDGRVTHILYSSVVDLTPYEGRLIGVEGEVDESVKWPIPALRVTAVVVPPTKPEGEGESETEKEEGKPADAGKPPAEPQ